MDAKSLNYFNTIKQILSSFDKTELAILGGLCEQTQRQSRAAKGHFIVTTLIKQPNISVLDLQLLIDPELSDGAFYKSLSRAKELILESLLLDVNIKNADRNSKQFINRATSRKRILQAHILFSKGLEVEGRKQLELVLDIARKYELYDELYEVLHWLRNENGLRFGKNKFDNYTIELTHVAKCRDALYKTRDAYYDYYIFSDRTGDTSLKITKIRSVLESLKLNSKKLNSQQIFYFYYLLESEYCALTKNLDEAIRVAEDLQKLLRKSPVLGTDICIGTANSDIADMMFSCGDFEASLKFSKKALERFDVNSYNALVAEEIVFKSAFLLKNYIKAKKVIARLAKHSNLENIPLMHCKFSYYNACVLFQEGEHKASLAALCGLKLLDQDKYGWNIAIRLLMFMNNAELDRSDLASAQIVSFRKFMDRLRLRGEILPRYENIYTILWSLRAKNLNYALTYRKHRKEFTQLSSELASFRCDEKSPELILFHQWFSKMAKAPH